ncbi:exocyst complex component 7 [Ostrinia nubilalis]|uniref:exocyst complex component 7 n=1 Tax=Ostrinia nubilalis TaxID=29057 RepID=UPI0030825ED0
MYAVEKKFEIEMKLRKEMSNIQELKAAANRSSSLASDVCNVLGACEQRLQQLETAVLPLYGDTARLQYIQQNMERTVKALDHVINYYMVSRELADLIQGGPHTTNTDSLNIYLEALDKLAEAQAYFNKNNPQSVELENINQLYNTGVLKLENAFEELLSRNTRPLSPTTLMDMIALEEDSSADSVSVSASGSGSGSSGALESMRAAAAWLSAAGRPPAGPLLAIRAPAAKSSLVAFKDYLRSRSMAASPLMVSGLLAEYWDFHRNNSEESNEALDEFEAESAGALAAGVCRLARLEQRALLGLVPLPRLPALLAHVLKDCFAILAADVEVQLVPTDLGLVPLPRLPALLAHVLKDCFAILAADVETEENDEALDEVEEVVLKDCFAILAADVERACSRSRRSASKCGAGAAACWALLGRLQRLQPDVERALAPAPPAAYTATVNTCQLHCLKSLEEWVEGVRNDSAAGAVDGTVHQLAAATLAHCHQLAQYLHTIGPALATDAAYARAASQLPGSHDRNAALLAIYMRKVLAQLNFTLRNKSEQYPDALKAIFLLNNTLYLLQGLQRSGLLDVVSLAEPECEASYRDMINDHKNAYLQSWNKLLAHTVLEEQLPTKLRDKDRQMLKDKFASFNREWEESTRAQRGYSVPDAELREALKRDNKQTLLPPYTAFYDACAALPFSKNPDKYVKYTPVQIATQLDGYFDEAA